MYFVVILLWKQYVYAIYEQILTSLWIFTQIWGYVCLYRAKSLLYLSLSSLFRYFGIGMHVLKTP